MLPLFPCDGGTGRRRCAPGATLVLLVVCMIPLAACVALAIDLGVLTFARTQLADAADAAALAGARTLNGNTAVNNNYSDVTPNAQAAVAANTLLGAPISTADLSLNIGRYVYNSTTSQFEGQFPGPSSQNWTMVQATVTANVYSNLAFAKLFSLSAPNLQAVATAAHRARDICLILDYSGSMRFSSLLGMPINYDNGSTSNAGRSSNNQDTVYPQFGHYSAASSLIVGAAATSPYANANISTSTSDNRPPIAQDFYQDANGTAAFTSFAGSFATTPSGDVPAKTNFNKGGSYAQTASQMLSMTTITNSTYNQNFEVSGYTYASYHLTPSGVFNGYTLGPGYWGKTFYIWPPNPKNDWRTAYFNFPTAQADNSLLWSTSNGNWQPPVVSGNSGYTIDYGAILTFIRTIGPQVFPPTLQSGRIVYYTQIPSTINTSTWPPTDLNQRFWKAYIDYVLGVMQTSSSTYVVINSAAQGNTGYGPDFQWGTFQITPLSKLTQTKTAPYMPYMNYNDNPIRPLLSFWFGPMTMIDFLGNYNLWYSGYGNNCSQFCWWPGTCHEAPLYLCKLGVQAALGDIQNNHPNDFVSLIMFSTPLTGTNDTSGSRFNRVRVPLGQNYSALTASLWYPPATISSSSTVTPYDANNLEVPRAMGGTCYAMAPDVGPQPVQLQFFAAIL